MTQDAASTPDSDDLPPKPDGPLRRGWTTGCCAAAAARAALIALHNGGRFPDQISVRLPRGEQPSFALSRAIWDPETGSAEAGIIKDAGDDPDVTHGAEIRACVRSLSPGSGLHWRAGEGVGTVTRPGLALEPGQPAINPKPRAIIEDNLLLADGSRPAPDLEITVSIPGGEALAEKTLNGRLGILGGLSILGTTGIVEPFSCSAWIHSIHRGIDVARALALPHLAGATGRTSEAAIRALHDLPDPAIVDMGDFAGAVLTYLRRNPVPHFTIAGGFAKISKLADGHMDLHSRRSAVDFTRLAARLEAAGADDTAIALAKQASATGTVLEQAKRCRIDLPAVIATEALNVARKRVTPADGPSQTQISVAIFDRAGKILAHAA